MSDIIELAEAIQRTLAGLRYGGQDINFFFGRIKSVKYPFIDIYFARFLSSTAEQNFYSDIDAMPVIEFAYAEETEDLELYSIADDITQRLKNGLKLIHNEKSYIITPNDDFEHRIVDGYLQISFTVKYQVDTADKVAYDNSDKMETLDLTLTKETK